MSTDLDAPPEARIALLLDPGRERDELERALAARGWAPEDCETLTDATQHEVAIVDNAYAAREELQQLSATPMNPAVIVLASFSTIADAVESVRAGAFDFLSRPLSLEHVLFAVERALVQRRLRRENQVLRKSLEARVELGALHSKDDRMRRISEVVTSIADTRANVLIQGESGVGKSALARAIHLRSGRANKPFVVVDCGAIPSTLLESTLFGHVRGAFTGAARDKPGMIEAADGGTLLLDEIGNAPLDLQAKLLRVVQERVFERVGETRSRSVDLRWIAATHRDLRAEAALGRFREDLYWRLNVVAIELPPLRERAGDIPMLAEAFVERYAAEHQRAARSLQPDAMAALCAHDWPGNVRELEHVLERAVLLARGDKIEVVDLGQDLAQHAPAKSALLSAASLKQALEAPERRLIEDALAACGGRRKEAARRLGINRTTLFNKMRRFGLIGFPRGELRASDAATGS